MPESWRRLGAEAAGCTDFWVSTGGTVSPLHYDGTHTFLAQVKGRKRMLLWPAEAIGAFSPYPLGHPLYRRSRVDIQVPEWATEEEHLAEQRRQFPAFFAQAADEAEEALLGPGDAVFFPAFWFHHTESLDLSFSVGFRYFSVRAA
uniref:JmjC domain-containing protein n=1 Tax=Cryptomonas curvata TaxID=233186 RepID=A0A7S0LX10_9CRYP